MGMRHGGMGRMVGREKSEKASRPVGVLLKALGGFLKGLGWLMVIASLISMIYSITQIISPLILTSGIDAFSEISNGEVVVFNRVMTMSNAIILLTIIYGSLNIIGFFLNSLSTRVLAKANASFVNNIRIKLYSKLINSSISLIK